MKNFVTNLFIYLILVFGFHAFFTISAEAGDQSTIPDNIICLDALSSNKAGWDLTGPFSEKVAEAKRRGLTIEKCGALIIGNKAPSNVDSEESSTNSENSQLDARLAGKADKIVAPRDLAIQSHKYDGKIVEATLNCFYADVSDFRCIDISTYSHVRIDFRSFDAEGQKYIEGRSQD